MPSRVRAPENRGGYAPRAAALFWGHAGIAWRTGGKYVVGKRSKKPGSAWLHPSQGGGIRPRAAGGGYDVRSQPSGCMMNSSHQSSQRVSGHRATRELSLRTGACRRHLPLPCRSASDVPSAFHARQVAHCLNCSTTFTHGDPSFRYQPWLTPGGRHQGHPWCRPRRSVTHHPRRGAASCLTAQRIRLRRAARAPLGAGQDHNVRADPLALDRLSALK